MIIQETLQRQTISTNKIVQHDKYMAIHGIWVIDFNFEMFRIKILIGFVFIVMLKVAKIQEIQCQRNGDQEIFQFHIVR